MQPADSLPPRRRGDRPKTTHQDDDMGVVNIIPASETLKTIHRMIDCPMPEEIGGVS
ncbi:MAG: hypothetical protein HQ591_06790 [candidate division Zixibacteria bacterium]|nr:hypothetical protein [Candidatus Tariuqbacter arcticus]